jgi:hypothetical protein
MNRRSALKSFLAGTAAVTGTAVASTPLTESTVMPVKPVINELLMDMAVEIVKGESISHVYYIDIGLLPKLKAEKYLANIVKNYRNDSVPAIFLPFHEGKRTNSVESIVRPYTMARVMEVYDQLKAKTA